MTASPTTAPTLMQRLKEETWPMHQEAESQPLEQHLIKGTLHREVFVRYLGQRYLIHKAFEAHLNELAPRVPAIAALFAPDQNHAPRAAADLVYFGQSPAAVEPLQATRDMSAFFAELAHNYPVALLGVMYVFEGSTNGARFIARAVRGAYILTDGGTAYLDPYGEQQRAKWSGWKQAMDAYPFSDADKNAIVDAAKRTFLGTIAFEKELYGLPVSA